MPFFDYRQNNTGGSFVSDHVAGISLTVIVEAADWREANERAEMIGLYFDGCSDGRDCSCCGDRWYPKSDWDKGDEVPSVYGNPVEKEVPERLSFAVEYIGGKSKPTIYVHYLSGAIGNY